MNGYWQTEYGHMFYKLNEFLNNHTPSELMDLVMGVINWREGRGMGVYDERTYQGHGDADAL